MSDVTVKSGSSIGALGILGIILVLLKAFGISAVANWSWWWVLAPFWVGFAVALVVLVLFIVMVGVLAVFAALTD